MNIGAKINQLRKKNGLTQEELANRCELSKGFISQVERGLTSPSIATLSDIVECLGTDLKNFFNETVQEKIVFSKSDIFEKEGEKSKIDWLIPNAQKNAMEPILIHLEQGGQSILQGPHEGEEFGYVLSGTIYIYLGNKRYKAKKGDSFYFRPTSDHYLKNAGKTKATILWIATPPSF